MPVRILEYIRDVGEWMLLKGEGGGGGERLNWRRQKFCIKVVYNSPKSFSVYYNFYPINQDSPTLH
ncbi:MAG: hypothetical protein LBV74_09000 [Tannerella sp.]|nr:hypothetical protein [Tannerella sp.]